MFEIDKSECYFESHEVIIMMIIMILHQFLISWGIQSLDEWQVQILGSMDYVNLLLFSEKHFIKKMDRISTWDLRRWVILDFDTI